MKKMILILFCFFSFYVLADVHAAIDPNCPYQVYSSKLIKHYFSVDQIKIENNSLFLNINDKIVPLFQMRQDSNGYFSKFWDDTNYCPECTLWSYSPALNLCLNPMCELYPIPKRICNCCH
jgi:hypothetical protein